MISEITLAGVVFIYKRAYRSSACSWHSADGSIGIYNSIMRDRRLTVFVNGELLPRSYKTASGAARAAIKAKEQPR